MEYLAETYHSFEFQSAQRLLRVLDFLLDRHYEIMLTQLRDKDQFLQNLLKIGDSILQEYESMDHLRFRFKNENLYMMQKHLDVVSYVFTKSGIVKGEEVLSRIGSKSKELQFQVDLIRQIVRNNKCNK